MEQAKLFMMMPEEVVEEFRQLAKDCKKIIATFKNQGQPDSFGDWIPESEAQRMLGRKTTWFYNKRKSKELTGKKRGGRWWYSKAEIQNYIEG